MNLYCASAMPSTNSRLRHIWSPNDGPHSKQSVEDLHGGGTTVTRRIAHAATFTDGVPGPGGAELEGGVAA